MPACRDQLDCLQQISDDLYMVNERSRDVLTILSTKSDLTTYFLIPVIIFLFLLVLFISLAVCRFWRVIVRVRDNSVQLLDSDRAVLVDNT